MKNVPCESDQDCDIPCKKSRLDDSTVAVSQTHRCATEPPNIDRTLAHHVAAEVKDEHLDAALETNDTNEFTRYKLKIMNLPNQISNADVRKHVNVALGLEPGNAFPVRKNPKSSFAIISFKVMKNGDGKGIILIAE